MLILLSLAAAIAAPLDRHADVKDVMLATSVCLDSTSTKQARISVPPTFGFVADGSGYKKPDNLARIRFDFDQDGIARTCTVTAEIASASRDALEKVIGATYRGQPQHQQSSVIWLFQRRGVQGVQLFPTPAGERLQIKIIAATFVEPK
jgi:hypothetical protein